MSGTLKKSHVCQTQESTLGKKRITILLEYPPTANHMKLPIVMKVNGKHTARLITAPKGREYFKRTVDAFIGSKELKPPYEVYIEVHVPDLRKRDLPNVEKASMDALDKAGIIKDDSLINKITMVRFPPLRPDGILVVRIEEVDGNTQVQSIAGQDLSRLGYVQPCL